jgi:hypothetical protein
MLDDDAVASPPEAVAASDGSRGRSPVPACDPEREEVMNAPVRCVTRNTRATCARLTPITELIPSVTPALRTSAVLLVCVASCGRLHFDREPPGDAPGGAVNGAPDAPGPGVPPLHDYRLAGSYADERGGPPLTGHGGTFVAGGYQFDRNLGLSVVGAMPGSVYTVDVSFTFDTLGSWRKILDFKNLSADTGFYTFDNSLQFVVVPSQVFETSPPILTAGTPVRITLTRDAASNVVGYVNGARQIAFIDTRGVAALGPDAPAIFFIDDQPTQQTEASSGTVRRIRIYDTVLDASQLDP